jgi:hypothetical protein
LGLIGAALPMQARMPFSAEEPADMSVSPGHKAERISQWDVELVRILIQALRSMGYR